MRTLPWTAFLTGLVLSLVLFSSAPVSARRTTTDNLTCTDPDGGLNAGEKSTTIDTSYFVDGKPYSFKDTCADVREGSGNFQKKGDYLYEGYCLGDQTTIQQRYCLHGCVDGACIDGEVSCGNGICDLEYQEDQYNCAEDCASEGKCFDRDGSNIYRRSAVRLRIAGRSSPPLWDKCEDADTLLEFTCNGTQHGFFFQDCPKGCKNGRCAK